MQTCGAPSQAQVASVSGSPNKWVAGLWICAAVGCADAVPTDPVPAVTCKCEAGKPCPVNACDLQIELSQASCAGKVSKVEILLGDQLEPQPVLLGTPRRLCAGMNRGQVLPMRARSDTSWQWNEDIACPPASPDDTQGVTVVRVLNCIAATP